jgi:hypothetical protein
MYRGAGSVVRGLGPEPGVSSRGRSRLACDTVELLGAIDNIGGAPVDHGGRRVEPADLEREQRRVAARVDRQAHHPVADQGVVPDRWLLTWGLEATTTSLAPRACSIEARTRDRATTAAAVAEPLAPADRQLEAAAGSAGPVEPPPVGGHLVGHVRGGGRLRFRRRRSNAPVSPTRRLPTGRRPTGRCPTGRCPTGRCPTGRCPTGRRPTGDPWSATSHAG